MDKMSDEIIRKNIKKAAERISLDEGRSEKLFSEILERTEERRKVMSISRGKKLALAMAAVLAVGSITAIASGRVATLTLGTNLEDSYVNLADMEREAGKVLGEEPDCAETLGGEFKFDRGFVTGTDMADENGVDMGSFPEAIFDYRREGNEGENLSLLSLSVSNPPESLREQWTAEGVNDEKTEEIYGDVTLYLSEDKYLFLPPDETPTEEEKALEKGGELCISYGTDEREEHIFKSASWEKDGLRYLLSTYAEDTDLTELSDMAKEIINN